MKTYLDIINALPPGLDIEMLFVYFPESEKTLLKHYNNFKGNYRPRNDNGHPCEYVIYDPDDKAIGMIKYYQGRKLACYGIEQEEPGYKPYVLTGHEAIAFAKENVLELSMRNTLSEEARDGLSIEEARKVAESDPSMIFVVAPAELYPGLDAKQSGSAVPTRTADPASTHRRTKRNGAVMGR